MKAYSGVLLGVFFALAVMPGASPGQPHLPRLPGARLLVGYPGFDLVVTTKTETWRIQEGEGDIGVTPAISRDGTIVSTAREHPDVPRSVPVLTLATYSIPDKKWREYTRLEYHGAVTVSPDGSELAFAAGTPGTASGVRVRLIDLKRGTEIIGPVIGAYDPLGLTWAPDGRSIAYGMEQPLPVEGPRRSAAIEILEIATGKIRKVAEGQAPAWSPSGDWIAFFNPSDRPNRVWMVRPDGTDANLLVALPGERLFHESKPPVWSPDSTKILLNEIADADKWTFDIHLLDVATRRMTRKFKNSPPVYGWAQVK